MGTGARLVAAIATVVLVGAGCASSSTSPAGSSPAGPSPAGPSPVPSVGVSPTGSSFGGSVAGGSLGPSAASLIVLADGVQGGVGLWRFRAPDKWTAIGPTPGAMWVARTAAGVALVAGQNVELRSSSDLARVAATIGLKWPAVAPSAPVVAVDRAPGGKLALVTSDGSSVAYAVASADGRVTVLQPAPTQSFTPLIAWLDDTRLLVLSTDKQQVSTLAVIDTAAGTMTPIRTIGGIDFFALSSDRMTLVASTERDIFVAPVSEWIAGAQPQKIASVDAFRVIWGLALDSNGTHLALLSGAVSADGHVSQVHEVGYTRGASAWSQSFDNAAPFTTSRGQVWVS
jgi:hypothetical protein